MSSLKENSNFKNDIANNSSGKTDLEIGFSSPFHNASINSISFLKPMKLTLSAWLEHIPFAFWLINAHKPQVLVELGTHYGSSYFSFCQAIDNLHLSTRCYAIDMWKGDDHAGFYGEDVYSSVQNHNSHMYSQFSTLMRMPFEEGVKYFKDGEVDLLHIDGFHTYDAVKNDFDSWLPKLSNRAVVIIHDSNVRKADFGVYRFVAELRQAYPCFEFSHGHGLTIVGVGAEQRKEMLNLFEADNDERRIRNIQEVFSRLGKACSDEYAVEAFKKTIAENKIELNMTAKELTDLKKNKIEYLSESSLLKSDLEKYQVENERLRIENLKMKSDINSVSELISQREHEINQILNSTSWRITLPIRFAKRAIRYFVRRLKRLFLKDKNNYSLLPISTTEFDREWYLDTYLDIKDSGIDPYEHYLEHGHAEGRYASEAEYKKALAPDLDENWYHETYSDVKLAGLTALHHYIHYGRAEGRFSSLARLYAQDFDENWYLQNYPDVAKSDMDPLEHYLLHGHAEGRKPCEMPRMLSAPYFRYGPSEYGARDMPLLIDSDIKLNENFSQSIGVHLHLYYFDLSSEFVRYLNNIPKKFDLYISIPKGKYNKHECESAFSTSLKLLNKLVVRETENVGRDIFPFVVEFGQELLAYDVILHIHSKKSPQSKTRGWRRFLLHYTLGSKAITTQILNAFANDPRLGAYFPAYFHATTRQPLWGSNRSIVEKQLNRLGFQMDMTYCPDYPAGSFFWARSEAYKPLFDGDYRLEDFDSEQGQFDGTLAHGFERLFGVLPLLQNYSTKMSFVDRDYRLVNYFDKERFASLPKNTLPHFEVDRTSDISSYKHEVDGREKKQARIALVTTIIGGFDALMLPKYLEGDVDYHCFSDTLLDGYGVFHIHKPPYIDADPRRTARYIKTNALKYIKNYDYVVWIDANVELNVKLSELVSRVSSTTHKMGAIQHPVRNTLFEESDEIIAWNLDDAAIVKNQIKRYESIESLTTALLIESNVLVLDARERKIHNFMRLWWNEINNHSRRDQLSIAYALYEAEVTWQPLLDEQQSTRDSDEFALYRHGINDWGPQPHIYSSWYSPAVENVGDICITSVEHANVLPDQLDLDIVICVHNALEDVRACLDSLEDNLVNSNVIIVDDASELDTKQFLEEYAREKPVKLIRQDIRLGYTKTSNNGIRSGTNKNVLLLNSDTIVPKGALNKLCAALDSNVNLGVVGPLSNAASTQSVPSIKGTVGQTAINALPDKLTPTVIDAYFQDEWDFELVRVPLVHGFCFMVKRCVFEAVGLFDENSFPHGYGEENDFCFRVADAGLDLAVLTNTYIYHAKSKSYASDERVRLMDEGMKALVHKYSVERIQRSVATMQIQPKLEAARIKAQNLYQRYGAN